MKKEKVDSKSKIMPLADRILIRPLQGEDRSPSGIIIPDTVSKEKPEHGKVIAVGPGKYNEDGDERVPLSVKVGDTVLFSKYGYDEVKIDGEEYFILREENILTLIK